MRLSSIVALAAWDYLWGKNIALVFGLEKPFFAGVLEICGCRTWFFDGENVVKCVVIVVFWVMFFCGKKCDRFLRFIFRNDLADRTRLFLAVYCTCWRWVSLKKVGYLRP